MRLTIHIISAAICLASLGCSKDVNLVESLCRQKFHNVIHGFETNGTFGKDELANAFRMILDVGDIPKRAKLLKEFEDEFFGASGQFTQKKEEC